MLPLLAEGGAVVGPPGGIGWGLLRQGIGERGEGGVQVLQSKLGADGTIHGKKSCPRTRRSDKKGKVTFRIQVKRQSS